MYDQNYNNKATVIENKENILKEFSNTTFPTYLKSRDDDLDDSLLKYLISNLYNPTIQQSTPIDNIILLPHIKKIQ
jgi:hypothetical protein